MDFHFATLNQYYLVIHTTYLYLLENLQSVDQTMTSRSLMWVVPEVRTITLSSLNYAAHQPVSLQMGFGNNSMWGQIGRAPNRCL